MIEVKGKYNDAIIYSDRYDDTAYKQILDFCNLKSFSGAQICVMMAYKPAQEIIDAIEDTVKIKQIIKPIYNFKA